MALVVCSCVPFAPRSGLVRAGGGPIVGAVGDVTTIGSPGDCGELWAGVCIIGTVLSADETCVLFIAELCWALSSCELIVHTPFRSVSVCLELGIGGFAPPPAKAEGAFCFNFRGVRRHTSLLPSQKNLRPLVERGRKLLCVGLKLEMLVPEPLTGGISTYLAPLEAQPRMWLAQRVHYSKAPPAVKWRNRSGGEGNGLKRTATRI